MLEAAATDSSPPGGRVWLLADNPREPEIVFDFPFDDELNEAVKRVPGRWFDWRRKHWRVPAEPRLARVVGAILARFPALDVDPAVAAFLTDSERFRAVVSVTAREGRGVFVMRVLAGDPPEGLPGAEQVADARLVVPFGVKAAEAVVELEGAQLDDLARACARELRAGRAPAPAELALELDEDGEPELALFTIWDPHPAREFRRLPEAHPVHRPGRFYMRDSSWGVAAPADPALAERLHEFVAEHPAVYVEEPARELLDEVLEEHRRASKTVALSYAEDATLDDLSLGGELHPFQRAGVRYALQRRRTFIADEQGLGKTIQALAAMEAADAFPAAVICPASVKLNWQRETQTWLAQRSVAVVDGRTSAGWPVEADDAELVVLNYDILEAHLGKLLARGLRALVLDESHYVKNARAQRTKATIELAARLPDDALRLALTGTPVLNRPEELVSQLRAIGRLADFGSGARLSRRFRDAGRDDRL